MKKALFLLAVLASFLAIRAYCATTQAQSVGVIQGQFKSLTAAQVITSTSTGAGEFIYCSDCLSNGAKGTICISTGTAAFSFVLSSGTACK